MHRRLSQLRESAAAAQRRRAHCPVPGAALWRSLTTAERSAIPRPCAAAAAGVTCLQWTRQSVDQSLAAAQCALPTTCSICHCGLCRRDLGTANTWCQSACCCHCRMVHLRVGWTAPLPALQSGRIMCECVAGEQGPHCCAVWPPICM